MNQFVNTLIASVALMATFDAQAAIPGSVKPCVTDTYISQRIQDEVPAAERVDIFNFKGEIVGAFHQDPVTSKLHGLYLCGTNSGYYYAEGNLHEGVVSAIYNDEYDSELETQEVNGLLKISISIRFSGDEESADYGALSADLFIKL